MCPAITHGNKPRLPSKENPVLPAVTRFPVWEGALPEAGSLSGAHPADPVTGAFSLLLNHVKSWTWFPAGGCASRGRAGSGSQKRVAPRLSCNLAHALF